MGKTKYGNREFNKEQKLLHENERLKRELSTLRKQLARIDLDRYSNVKEIIEEHYKEDRQEEGREILEKMKEQWRCVDCGTGFLEIVVFSKVGKPYYFRKCNNCAKRTRSQAYDPKTVQGIINDPKGLEKKR